MERSDGRDKGRSDLSRLARGSTINFAGAVTNGLFGFLFVLVITHGLATRTAGVFFEAIALFSILSNVVQLGADDGLVRTIPRLRALGRTQDIRRTVGIALWPVLVVSGLVAGVAFVLAPQVSHVFVHGRKVDPQALVPYIRIMAPFLPLWAASNPILAGTRGFGTMLPTVAVDNFGKPAIRTFLAMLVVTAGLGASALALSWAVLVPIGTVLGFAWLMTLLRRAEGSERSWRHHRTPRSQLASEFWRFSLPRAVAAIFGVTVYWLDTLLLGALKDIKDAAIYTAASRYLFLAWFAVGAVQQMIAPMISGLITTGNRERAQTIYQTGTQWLMTPSWPVLFTLAVFAPLLLQVFRPAYASGQHALLILSLAMLVNSAAGPVMVTLLMAGKSTWALMNSAAGLGVNLSLNLLLIPRLGMVGAALAWAASMIVINVAAVIQVGVLLKLRPFGPGARLVGIGALVCYGVLGLIVRATFGLSIWSFLMFGAVATLLYVSLLWRFRGLLHLDILRQGVRLRRQRLDERTFRA